MKLRAVSTANPQQRDVNAAAQVDHARAVCGAQRLADAQSTASNALTLNGAEL